MDFQSKDDGDDEGRGDDDDEDDDDDDYDDDVRDDGDEGCQRVTKRRSIYCYRLLPIFRNHRFRHASDHVATFRSIHRPTARSPVHSFDRVHATDPSCNDRSFDRRATARTHPFEVI